MKDFRVHDGVHAQSGRDLNDRDGGSHLDVYSQCFQPYLQPFDLILNDRGYIFTILMDMLMLFFALLLTLLKVMFMIIFRCMFVLPFVIMRTVFVLMLSLSLGSSMEDFLLTSPPSTTTLT